MQAALVVERLNGMKLGISLRQASKRIRQRLLNHWSIMTFQRILMAKAYEYGVPVVLVNPKLWAIKALCGSNQYCP